VRLFHRRRYQLPAPATTTKKAKVKHMKISELVAALNKAQQLVGDAPVILKSLEGDVETEFKDLVSAFDLATGQTEPTVTLTHGAPAQQPVEPAAAEPAQPSDQVAQPAV
jgi:hypothetical protein